MTRGRKPDPTLDLRIKEGAVRLMLDKGLAFTMDEVAEAAGVGRASVFRRYATKRDLLLATMTALMDAQIAIPDTGSLEGDLRVIVSDTVTIWRDPAVATLARQVYGEAGRDPAVAAIVRDSMRTRMERSWTVYDRAIARGELAQDADLWLLTDLFAGLVAYRGLLGMDFGDTDAIVHALLHGFSQEG
ncbi:TetR/AcrR family transcriptional regulator [Nonomuraea sp. NPDC049152]|uniref:TetR/AcrR family transcriptional regulator n=1 Tax=Nonomuraea sp. NPDC049152 TaxID=3154350 RepID=UPI0033EC1116